MDKHTYTTSRQNLADQLAEARKIEASFDVFEQYRGKLGGMVAVWDARDAARRLVSDIETEIRELDIVWDYPVEPALGRHLVTVNED